MNETSLDELIGEKVRLRVKQDPYLKPVVEATATGPGPERGEKKGFTDVELQRVRAFVTYWELKK